MAVTAIDAVIAHMMFVAERDRLLKRDIDVGAVGRPIDFRRGPSGRANQQNAAEDNYAGMNIRAG
jgi:hypothetical protein